MNRVVATPVKAWVWFAKHVSPVGPPVFASYDGAGADSYSSETNLEISRERRGKSAEITSSI